jgi:DNA-binding response OmpR family regulator
MAKRILVVDDSRTMAMKTCAVLRKHGYETDSLCEPLDACEFLCRHAIDLVILDVEMPGKTGFQICDELRAMEAFENLPVVFLTCRDDHLDRLKGYAVGAQEYIDKDYDEAAFIGRIRRLIGA